MNLLGKLLFKMAGVQTGQTYSLQDVALGKFFGTTSHSGKPVSEDSMMQVSAAWSCMRILSETIGSLPWHVYEDDGTGNSRKVTDHAVAEVLTRSPNLNMTSVEYREAAVLNLCQAGNGYSFKETRDNGDLVALTPIESCNVQPEQKQSGEVVYKVMDRGKWEVYPQEKIWHVKGFGRNGLVGLSPLGAAREAIGTALATEEFGAKFFSQGGMPSGTLTFPGWLNADQRVIARENMNQMLGGLGNAHKFAMFEGGMKPEPWGNMPLEDMQFILTRKFSIQEICRFYRIPPHMVADLDRATFSNIEHMSQEFVMFTLMPYFTRFEASATKWLFKPADRQKFFLRFNYEGLLRADSAARATFYNNLLQNGVMTRNEVRAKENLPRSKEENMDSFTVQLNMTPIEKLGEEKPAPAPGKVDLEDPMPEKPEKTAGDNTFNLVMPETMKQHLTQRVEVPGVAKLADVTRESAERLSLSNAALVAHVMKLTEKTEKNIEDLKELVTADRVAIFNDKGEPVGTRIVRPFKLDDIRAA
jgi:HK97 family phage portal protein